MARPRGGVLDSDLDGNLDITTVSFDQTSVPGGIGTDTDFDGDINQVVVPGEGTWTVDESGNVLFTPVAGFTDDPTPIEYTVNDTTGLTSNEATITIDYAPVATNDVGTYIPGSPSGSIDILANDTTGDVVDPTTVTLELTGLPGTASCTFTDVDGDCVEVTIPGEGVWTVDETTGAAVFTPETGYTGDPVITYTVEDAEGNPTSATITLTTVPLPMTISGTVFYDYNQLLNNTVDGLHYIPPGINAVLVQVNSDGSEEVVEVTAVPSMYEPNPGQYSFTSGSGYEEYYVMLSTTTPAIGSEPPVNSSLPPTYINTGENIGAGVGHDGVVDGESANFGPSTGDVVEVNFGILRFISRTVD